MLIVKFFALVGALMASYAAAALQRPRADGRTRMSVVEAVYPRAAGSVHFGYRRLGNGAIYLLRCCMSGIVALGF
jgi:hypothetical protein